MNTPSQGGESLRFLLLGHPVAHSLSPAMHNAAFRHLGIEAKYEVLDVPDAASLPAAVGLLRNRPYAGANVTIPHKVAVLDLVDEVTPRARRMGAVNTIIPGARGRLTGDNTDGYGLLTAIAEAAGDGSAGMAGRAGAGTAAPALGGEARQSVIRNVVMFGAGGAARACLVALGDAGASRVTLVVRRPKRAQAMVAAVDLPPRIEVDFLPWPAAEGGGLYGGGPEAFHTAEDRIRKVLTEADLLLNTTPVTGGDAGDPILSPKQFTEMRWANPGCLFGDLVYRPERTAFLRPWAAAGGTTVTGLSVLLHQGIEAFRLWLGRPAPATAMAAAIGIGSTDSGGVCP